MKTPLQTNLNKEIAAQKMPKKASMAPARARSLVKGQGLRPLRSLTRRSLRPQIVAASKVETTELKQ